MNEEPHFLLKLPQETGKNVKAQADICDYNVVWRKQAEHLPVRKRHESID